MVSDGERQSWMGFGGCFNELGAVALSVLGVAARRKVMQALFGANGCRFNLGRLPIGASDYAVSWYSLNETDGDFAMRRFSIERDRRCLIPYIREALAIRKDMTLFASPWSPPTWMKHPKVYNYGTLVWTKRNLEAYALYFVKAVRAYRQAGVPVTQIHVQNEPVADQKFPSCKWTGEQMRDFIRDHLGPAFRRHRLDCEIWLGTLNTGDYNAYPLTVLSDPRANAFITGVGFQWDGKLGVQRTRAAWPEKKLLQTENECGDGQNTWAYAHYVFDLLQHYITNGVNGYVYWNMVLAPEGRSTWGWKQNAMITVDPQTRRVVLNPEFYAMKHFARFVQPGAKVLGVSGHWAGNAVAFRNPDGGLVCVVGNPLKRRQELVLNAGGRSVTATLRPESFNTLCL